MVLGGERNFAFYQVIILTSVNLVYVYAVYTYVIEDEVVGLALMKYERLPITYRAI